MTGFNSDPPLQNFIKILQKNPEVENTQKCWQISFSHYALSYAFCTKNTFSHTSRVFIIFC